MESHVRFVFKRDWAATPRALYRAFGDGVAQETRDSRRLINPRPADTRRNPIDPRDAKRLRGPKPFAAKLNRSFQRAQGERRRTHRKHGERLAIDFFRVESARVPGG